MEEYMPTLGNLRSISKLYDKLSQPVCSRHAISKTEMDVLAFLCNHPKKNTASDIVELRLLPKANVSQAVDALIRKGMLLRIPDETDRRKIHLSVTDFAAQAVKDIHTMQNEFFTVLFDGCSKEQTQSFIEQIAKIAENSINTLKGNEKNGKK